MKGAYIAVTTSVCCFILLSDASFSQSQAIRSQQLQQSDASPGAVQRVPMPDLVVSRVFFTPSIATPRDRIMINVEITNQGNAAAVVPPGKALWAATKPNRRGIGPISTGETIGPRLSIYRSFPLFNAGEMQPGIYGIPVTADPANSMRESNETNNQVLCTLTIYETSWRTLFQEAISRARELRNTRIETELRSGEATMLAAEQLSNKKPISRPAAQSTVNELSDRIQKLENLLTTFENYDQRANQLFSILSSVLKSMNEMQNGIIRNMN